jgi:hypothetical protein
MVKISLADKLSSTVVCHDGEMVLQSFLMQLNSPKKTFKQLALVGFFSQKNFTTDPFTTKIFTK